jgi:hypothetical protein
MGLALFGGVGTVAGIRHRLALGKYPAEKVSAERRAMWAFLVMGIVFFFASLVRSLTY